MRGDTFISLSFSDQILSAEFLSKRSKFFGVKNWHLSGYFYTLPRLLDLLKIAPRQAFFFLLKVMPIRVKHAKYQKIIGEEFTHLYIKTGDLKTIQIWIHFFFQKLCSFFYLHFIWLYGSWHPQRILKK